MEYPQDIIDAAKNALAPIMSPDLASDYEIRLVAKAIMDEREQCARIVLFHPSPTSFKEVAAAIRGPTVDMVDYVEIHHNTEDEDAALRARIEAAIRATPVSENERKGR